MDYYYITNKNTQYYNCLYCLKYYKPNRFIFNNVDESITIKDDITYYFSNGLYNEISSKYKRTKMPNAYDLK